MWDRILKKSSWLKEESGIRNIQALFKDSVWRGDRILRDQERAPTIGHNAETRPPNKGGHI
jgi:hypothetical protein